MSGGPRRERRPSPRSTPRSGRSICSWDTPRCPPGTAWSGTLSEETRYQSWWVEEIKDEGRRAGWFYSPGPCVQVFWCCCPSLLNPHPQIISSSSPSPPTSSPHTHSLLLQQCVLRCVPASGASGDSRVRGLFLLFLHEMSNRGSSSSSGRVTQVFPENRG